MITAAVSYGQAGERTGSGGCSWSLVDGSYGAPGVGVGTWPVTLDGVVYHLWEKSCPDGFLFYSIPEQSPQDLVPELLRQLRDRVLPKPAPVFELLDPEFGWAYVRTPLTSGRVVRGPVSVTASIGPVWATVTALPMSLTFDPGDPAGTGPVSCGGDARSLRTLLRRRVCSYTYGTPRRRRRSTATTSTTLSIDWSISWTSSTGAGGALEPYSTSATSLLAVAEVKGLVTCTGPRPEQGGC